MGAAHRESGLHTLGLLLLAAVLGGCLVQGDPSFCSVQNAPSLLNIDVFQEVLSNHSDIANTLIQAPFVRGADETSPAYEFTAHGFHISEKGLSDSIRAASCATNELTLYWSVYFRDSQSAGPLLELSYANMAASKLPIFGITMNGVTDEIIVFYKHRGLPHSEAFRTRLHGGRWRRYAASLSGNLMKLYVNCVEIYSRLVPLPDYCANDSSNVMLTVVDSALREHSGFTTGLYVYLQNIGFQFGRGGIQQQCPIADDACPSCGQFLSLVEKVYDLREEIDALQQRVDDLEVNGVFPTANPTSPVPGEEGRSCIIGGQTVGHGMFRSPESGQVCYCQDGNAKCTAVTPLPCDPTATNPTDTPIDTSQPPTREPGDTDETPTPVPESCLVVELDNERIALDETATLFEADEQMCRTFTCVRQFGRLFTITSLHECSGNISTCSRDLSPELQRLALCCSPLNNCTACSFQTCPENAGCMVDGTEAVCKCSDGYEKNDDDECVDRDECSLGQQQGGNNCPANSKCLNTEGSFECECNLGYRFILDSNGALMCADRDECSEGSDSCPDNSICVNNEGSYDCNCTEDFIMDDSGECQPICDPPCLHGGNCTAPDTCACLPGYSGSRCELDVDECLEGTHGCTHPVAECINTVGGFFCRCQSGYQGNGTHCEDVDECDSDIHNCIPRSVCLNSPGSFACLCTDTDTICTGACVRRGEIILDGRSRLEGANRCRNCSCNNGEIYCRPRGCDCRNVGIDPGVTIKCCPQCFNRDCKINDTGTLIRPGAMWVNTSNRCQQCRCTVDRVLDCVDLSRDCPPLNCPNEYRFTPPGKCCPVCILPGCNAENEGKTVTMRNGCRTCRCENTIWRCTDRMICPPAESCVEEQVLFYRNGCCPICERQALGLQTCDRISVGS